MSDLHKHYYTVVFREAPGRVIINSDCFDHALGDGILAVVRKAAASMAKVFGFEYRWFVDNLCYQTVTVYEYPMGKPGANACVIITHAVKKSEIVGGGEVE